MRIVTSSATAKDGREGAEAAFAELSAQLGVLPDLLIVYCSSTYDCAAVVGRLQELAPGVPLQGGTSCLGAMTGAGLHSKDGFGLALLAISDPGGAYGVGAARLGDDPGRAATDALHAALERAGRPGEVPALVWISSAPGCEEAVIQGIEETLGHGVPIAGGSSADNDVAGGWSQFANGEVFHDGVAVTVLFPTTDIMFGFQSGYEPTALTGRVTRAEGRVLRQIDGQPAAEVYNRWLGGGISGELEQGGNILARTSMHPLGRVVGEVGGIPYYQLSHPDSVTRSGALTLFANVQEGDELVLMEGSVDSLVTRAGRVTDSMLRTHGAVSADVAGALVVFCAGCMLAIRERMQAVAEGLRAALGGNPFLCLFTFGEQGCFVGGENRHGNLMISVLIFSRQG